MPASAALVYSLHTGGRLFMVARKKLKDPSECISPEHRRPDETVGGMIQEYWDREISGARTAFGIIHGVPHIATRGDIDTVVEFLVGVGSETKIVESYDLLRTAARTVLVRQFLHRDARHELRLWHSEGYPNNSACLRIFEFFGATSKHLHGLNSDDLRQLHEFLEDCCGKTEVSNEARKAIAIALGVTGHSKYIVNHHVFGAAAGLMRSIDEILEDRSIPKCERKLSWIGWNTMPPFIGLDELSHAVRLTMSRTLISCNADMQKDLATIHRLVGVASTNIFLREYAQALSTLASQLIWLRSRAII